MARFGTGKQGLTPMIDSISQWIKDNAILLSALAAIIVIVGWLSGGFQKIYRWFSPEIKSEDIKLNVNKLVDKLLETTGATETSQRSLKIKNKRIPS